MSRVFVSRRIPGDAVERLAQTHDVEVFGEDRPPTRAELHAGVAEADGLLSMLTEPVDDELFDAAPRLRAVANYAVGFDNVDVEAATRRGIPIGNTPDVLTGATADLTLALMLGISRRLLEGDAWVRADSWGPWDPNLLLGRDLHGSTVGIVGYGRIGRAVGERVAGFGCEVIHNSRSGGVPLEELLERSDFVSVHCPLTPATRGLVGAAALERMKPTAYLVNTARGPIVDTEALRQALHTGSIAGAAIDVTDPEPLRADHPLLDAPNLLVLPHLGSGTRESRAAMSDRAVDNLLAALGGERMPFCVNPEVYERAATRPAP